MSIVKGIVRSTWFNDNKETRDVDSSATMDTDSGFVSFSSIDLGKGWRLLKEVFIDEDEDEFVLCSYCREYIMKNCMVQDKHVHQVLFEMPACSNSDCGSHEIEELLEDEDED